MDGVLHITLFLGFGPASSLMKRNAEVIASRLRELGIPVVVDEIRVPALDFEDFEPFAMVNGEETYIPSVSVDAEKLVDYFIATQLSHSIGAVMLPLPPSQKACQHV